ncbi:MAG: hypothetical protein WD118_08850 [Phycisphaeraceae bacterium]
MNMSGRPEREPVRVKSALTISAFVAINSAIAAKAASWARDVSQTIDSGASPGGIVAPRIAGECLADLGVQMDLMRRLAAGTKT